jgi:uncharacterized membrane protein
MPPVPLRLILLFGALVFFIMMVQFGMLTIAFDKLGLSQDSALLLFITILAGSMINLPLFSMKSSPPNLDEIPPQLRELWRQQPFTGTTTVYVNAGGCIVPVVFSFFLLKNSALSFNTVVAGVAAVSVLSYAISRRVPGVGLGMPILLAPIVAALVSFMLDPEHAAPLAYISGTLGVLIGADLLHIKDIKQMGSPFASIGGAGSFDGIFLTGIVAALLA